LFTNIQPNLDKSVNLSFSTMVIKKILVLSD